MSRRHGFPIEVEGVRLSEVRSGIELFSPRIRRLGLSCRPTKGLGLKERRLSVVSRLTINGTKSLTRVGGIQVTTRRDGIARIS